MCYDFNLLHVILYSVKDVKLLWGPGAGYEGRGSDNQNTPTEYLHHIIYFNIYWTLFIRLMTLNRVKLGYTVTFVK